MLYFGMVSLDIAAENAGYQAVIGSGLLGRAGEIVSSKISLRRCALISDSIAAPLYAERVRQSLTDAGIDTITVTVPSGDQSKSLEQVGAICDQMIAAGLDRQSFVVGVGGGMVGDLSGFVAAIFHRGVPHVQIPTTLLAMVDSSIGAKTGVNTAAGKNLIGAIHPPTLVIDDVQALRSLPEREFRQGFAEIIKHAIIADPQMFAELSRSNLAAWTVGNESDDGLVLLICRNIEIKSAIVAKDEMDRTGDRALLNFGHTIGHGVERAGNYQRFGHGEAISLGMVAAGHISVRRAGLSSEQHRAIIEVLEQFGLPVKLPPNIDRDEILAALKFDKKFEQGQIRLVVTPRIGAAYLTTEVTMNDIHDAVKSL
jgi:3-dehydroquinate synthase